MQWFKYRWFSRRNVVHVSLQNKTSFSSQTGVVSEQVNFVNMFCKDKRKQLFIFIRCLYWIVSWHSALASLFY